MCLPRRPQIWGPTEGVGEARSEQGRGAAGGGSEGGDTTQVASS